MAGAKAASKTVRTTTAARLTRTRICGGTLQAAHIYSRTIRTTILFTRHAVPMVGQVMGCLGHLKHRCSRMQDTATAAVCFQTRPRGRWLLHLTIAQSGQWHAASVRASSPTLNRVLSRMWSRDLTLPTTLERVQTGATAVTGVAGLLSSSHLHLTELSMLD
eukprot:COSAG02_NODE_2738_length_8128_cov_10.634201_6_plen_162_part_00